MRWGAEVARSGRQVQPIGALGVWAITLVAGAVAMMFVSTVSDWVTLADFERSWEERQTTRQEWRSNSWITNGGQLIQLAAGIVFITWLWRARSNAETLCRARHRLPIGWVIGGWICPVVNLWFPHMIVADVLRASDPRTPADESTLRGRPAGPLVTVWWLSLVTGSALAFLALILSVPTIRVEQTGDYLIYGSAPLGGFGLIAVKLFQAIAATLAALCLATIITRVRRWQENRTNHQSAHPGSSPAPATHNPTTAPAATTPTAEVTPQSSPDHRVPQPDSAPVNESGTPAAEPTAQILAAPTADAVGRTGPSHGVGRERAGEGAPSAGAESPPSVARAVTAFGPLPEAAVRDVGARVAARLAGIHALGLVHGDLRPDTVYLSPEGPRLGKARPREETSGLRPADDVAALATVLVVASTGHGPFESGGLEAISPEVRFLLAACMSDDPHLRPTAAELAQALTTVAPPAAAAPTPEPGLQPMPGASTAQRVRRRTVLAAGGVGAGVLGAGGLLTALAVRERTRPSTPPPPPGSVLWKTDIGAMMTEFGSDIPERPAVLGNSVFAVSVDGTVFALDAATGAVQWKAGIGGRFSHSPVAAGGRVFVHTGSRGVIALYAASGVVAWEAPDYGSPVYTDGTLVFTGRDDLDKNGLAALDAATGTERWAALDGRRYSARTMAVADGLLAVPTDDRVLCVLNSATGSLRWQVPDVGAADPTPVVGVGRVFTSQATKAYVYDAASGAPSWESFDADFEAATAAGDGLYLLRLDRVSAHAAATGGLRWQVQDDGTRLENIAVVGNSVFVTGDRQLRALDAATGAERWRYVNPFKLSAAAISNGIAYLIGDDRHIHAIRT
ncbi:hypothetical protein GCM10027089_42770 [Nocardia thraciensis]